MRPTTAVTFHDFRPKTSIGVSNQMNSVDKPSGDGSRSQMMLDRDVSGLSPEPKAELIISKNQI